VKRKNSAARALVGVLLILMVGITPGLSHPLDPALLELWESGDSTLQVLWRLPLTQPMDAPLRPVLPDGCTEISSPGAGENAAGLARRWRVTCRALSLVGQRIGVEGLIERRTDVLLRLHLADGRVVQAVLRGDSPFFVVPQQSGPVDVVRTYLALGFEHILTGLDHLLFVLGLVLLVHGRRRLLGTITAFTLGHSVTLSLAVLGFVHIPPMPVEALIACSILVVASELTRDARGRRLWMGRQTWIMAAAFGLLHGLGFAGALAQVGLPAQEIPLSLFSFNLGIEAGQLLFVGLVLAVRAALRSGLASRIPLWRLPEPWMEATASIPAYAIGSLSAFWIFERVSAIFLY
jgi:hydrogenase/urease accessory protein HupE